MKDVAARQLCQGAWSLLMYTYLFLADRTMRFVLLNRLLVAAESLDTRLLDPPLSCLIVVPENNMESATQVSV